MTRPFAVFVDDDPVSVDRLRSLLQEAGFAEELQVISKAETALTYFKALTRPDEKLSVVFVDLGFREGHGFEIIRAIRANPACARVYIVVLTGSSDPDDRHCAFSLGSDAYLQKFPGAPEMIQLREAVAARQR